MSKLNFEKTLIIGMGLIGSSIARAIDKYNISSKIYILDNKESVIKKCSDLKFLEDAKTDIKDFSTQFDLIVISSPLSSYREIFLSLDNFVLKKTLITDVGSTKVSVIKDYIEVCKNNLINFIPSHPIAGLEKSGPEYGFAELFENRYCILTPHKTNEESLNKIKEFWNLLGMKIEIMNAEHHDRVLAMTSHLPQLIAYSIIFTANELEDHIKDEVIKYSAGGLRDFSRLAGSDPIMWRDIYSKNKDSVIEMLGRFTEDLTTLQKAIRNNDVKFLEKAFTSTRKVRKTIEELGQAGSFDPREKKKK
tara:strand:- start:43 stop:960 length:918 start_codon:yes stop_codon:yes gene_type:complete